MSSLFSDILTPLFPNPSSISSPLFLVVHSLFSDFPFFLSRNPFLECSLYFKLSRTSCPHVSCILSLSLKIPLSLSFMFHFHFFLTSLPNPLANTSPLYPLCRSLTFFFSFSPSQSLCFSLSLTPSFAISISRFLPFSLYRSTVHSLANTCPLHVAISCLFSNTLSPHYLPLFFSPSCS